MFKATYNITRHYVCTISRKLKQTWKMSETPWDKQRSTKNTHKTRDRTPIKPRVNSDAPEG
jgi:hypothetical protein